VPPVIMQQVRRFFDNDSLSLMKLSFIVIISKSSDIGHEGHCPPLPVPPTEVNRANINIITNPSLKSDFSFVVAFCRRVFVLACMADIVFVSLSCLGMLLLDGQERH
jgi:hypothetical protein